MLIVQAGVAASEGIARREGWCGGEGLQAVSVAGCNDSIFPCGAAHQQQTAPGPSFSKWLVICYHAWGPKRDASPPRNPNKLLVSIIIQCSPTSAAKSVIALENDLYLFLSAGMSFVATKVMAKS